jgi:hypothetical protein
MTTISKIVAWKRMAGAGCRLKVSHHDLKDRGLSGGHYNEDVHPAHLTLLTTTLPGGYGTCRELR